MWAIAEHQKAPTDLAMAGAFGLVAGGGFEPPTFGL
jgi:hypothetical protein